jgi:hypothetical protein
VRRHSKELDFLEAHGYVVFKQVVPICYLSAVENALWEFQEMAPDDPQTWYNQNYRLDGAVPMFHHQALWDIRQYAPVYDAFCSIYATHKLWVSIDGACLKLPFRPGIDERPIATLIHCDIDPVQNAHSQKIQGFIALSDTAENQGGFQCLPGYHRRIHEMPDRITYDGTLWRIDTEGLTVEEIPCLAGDLVVWRSTLPHAGGINFSNRARLCQYITMMPALVNKAYQRKRRIILWKKCLTPSEAPFRDWRKIEESSAKPAQLSRLGQQLLGLEKYPSPPWEKPINQIRSFLRRNNK